ncbi:GyrI-like domain-containing protein [Flavihumibacter fluvii]|uniref:GyrI-like domain-containing protein n=1 Tax=Flavihumibacter fluvii TaxID=2838157 RepID=UPI001BDE203E|nr:GyrI-like domain-containing protein [Flavihumibacter fluvii]ULQ53995.1 GyrI-like domain-containing protein [Flavihumibacter fluvii]
MDVRIIDMPEKKLLGMRMVMSYSNNRTYELWHQFMPRRKEIGCTLNSDLYSLQIYPSGAGPISGNADTLFEKWAAVEVAGFPSIPDGMETMILAAGKYAVFIHQGPATTFMKTFHFIFNIWMPGTEFEMDDRPHFEVLPEGYRPNDPLAQEEIWIPIKFKA